MNTQTYSDSRTAFHSPGAVPPLPPRNSKVTWKSPPCCEPSEVCQGFVVEIPFLHSLCSGERKDISQGEMSPKLTLSVKSFDELISSAQSPYSGLAHQSRPPQQLTAKLTQTNEPGGKLMLQQDMEPLLLLIPNLPSRPNL